MNGSQMDENQTPGKHTSGKPADMQKIMIARTLRMTGTICFIGISITSGSAFKDLPPHTAPWNALPTSTLYSLGMSLAIALSAQIWLWSRSKKKSV